MSLNLDLLVQYFCSFVLVLACRFVWTFWCNIPAPLSWCKLSLCFDFLVQYPFFFVLVQTCPFAPGESLSPLFRLFGAISLLLCPGPSLSPLFGFLVQYPYSFVLVQVHWHGLSQFGVGPHSSGSQPQLVHWHTPCSISSIFTCYNCLNGNKKQLLHWHTSSSICSILTSYNCPVVGHHFLHALATPCFIKI